MEALRKYFFLWWPMVGEREVRVTGLHLVTLFSEFVVNLKLALFDAVETGATEVFDFFFL